MAMRWNHCPDLGVKMSGMNWLCWVYVRKRTAVLEAETEWAVVDKKRAVLEGCRLDVLIAAIV